MRRSFDLSCYFVVDPEACAGRSPEDVVLAALDGGATMVQYRDKRGDIDLARAGAKCVKRAIDDHACDIPFLINDYPELVVEIGADGVHVGQGDMSPLQVRKLIGDDAILGLTAFNIDHMAAINPAIVDYAGTGPVYPTQTDKGKPILGVEGLREVVALSPVPVVAIGGITAAVAADVMASGVLGIAVMRAISAAGSPALAAKELLNSVKR